MPNIPNTTAAGLTLTSIGDGTNASRWGSGVSSSSGMPSGTIVDFAGSSAPADWLLCDGSSVSTTTYATLFAAIGYTYGGSGASFNVPDLRNKMSIGVGTSYTLGSTGGNATTTLTVANLAVHSHDLYLSHTHDTNATHSHGFTEGTHHHATSSLSHSHAMSGGTHAHGADSATNYGSFWGNGTGHSYVVGTSGVVGGIDAGRMTATGDGTPVGMVAAAGLTGTYNSGSNITDISSSVASGSGTITSSTALLGPLATDVTGSATPFSNVPPYLALNKIIKT